MRREFDDPSAAFPLFIIRSLRRDTDVEGARMVRLTRPPKPQLSFFFGTSAGGSNPKYRPGLLPHTFDVIYATATRG